MIPRTPLALMLIAGMAIPSLAADRAPRPDVRSAAYQQQIREIIDRERTLIRAGLMDWRLARSISSVDDLQPVRKPITRSFSATRTRAHNINQPWGALIDADDFALDFEEPIYQITTLDPTAGNPFIPLLGTIHTNGNPWEGNTGSSYTGIVDNAAAQTGPRWDPDGADDDPATEEFFGFPHDFSQHGEIGGPDPLGEHGKFVAAAAGSMATQPFSFGSRLEGWLRHKYYVPTTQTPVVTIVDMYHDRRDSSMWWSPLSQVEGNFFVLSSFWFGYSFDTFIGPFDPFGIIDRPLILGPRPGDPARGNFFLHPASSPWRAKTDEWFSVGIRMTFDSYSVWVRDSQTIGVNGFAQNSIYDAFKGGADPMKLQGAFRGEIFENDWLQILPGVDDDPVSQIVEGYGTSLNDNVATADVVIDASGSPASPLFGAVGIDTFHFRGGFDPAPSNLPGWQPNDHYIDNYVVMGEPFFDCNGDLTGDDTTDGADLLNLLGGWGNPGLTDLDGDGTTSGTDLLLLLGGWGPCP